MIGRRRSRCPWAWRAWYARRVTEVIALDDASVALGGRDVVAGVGARVTAGELVAVVGPNGAGKTTLLRLVAGFLAPSHGRGRVRVFGADPAHTDRRALAKKLAYVPQRYELAFPFTALEVVLVGRYPHRRGPGLDSADDLAIARAAMARFDLTGLDDRRFDQLSGGEQRRVLLAQAACQGASCLLLDEPTAALDPAHARAVFAGLRAQTDEGAAVLLVTHDLNLAARYATCLWVMDGGHLTARGRPEEVLAGGAIRSAFAIDFLVGKLPDDAGAFVVPK
jgi:iron complex transport system ATP-binding protein